MNNYWKYTDHHLLNVKSVDLDEEKEVLKHSFTHKIWNVSENKYMSNGNFERAAYDCFPEKSVKQIAGRLCGKGNYEIHKFKLEKVQ